MAEEYPEEGHFVLYKCGSYDSPFSYAVGRVSKETPLKYKLSGTTGYGREALKSATLAQFTTRTPALDTLSKLQSVSDEWDRRRREARDWATGEVERVIAIAAGSGTAETSEAQTQAEGSQSGPKGIAQGIAP